MVGKTLMFEGATRVPLDSHSHSSQPSRTITP